MTYTITYSAGAFCARFNGIEIASGSSYMAADAQAQPLIARIEAARSTLAELATPPESPVAPTRPATSFCLCPVCQGLADIADGVYRCSVGHGWFGWLDGREIAWCKSKAEAEAEVHRLCYEHLRRSA